MEHHLVSQAKLRNDEGINTNSNPIFFLDNRNIIWQQHTHRFGGIFQLS